jgi:hypothetical protein
MSVANSLREDADRDTIPVSRALIAYLAGSSRGVSRLVPPQIGRFVRSLLLWFNAKRIVAGKPPVLISEAGRVALDELAAADALFLSGAGTLNDRYATSVGGFWCILFRTMAALRKPVVASGQQIGPLTRPLARLVVKWGLRRIDAMGVREPVSFECAVRLGIPEERVVLTGDDAWNLAPAPAELARSILIRHGISGPFIAAQVRFGSSTGWRPTDGPAIGETLSQVAEDLALPIVFVLLSHSRLGNDEQEAVEIVNRYVRGERVVLTERLDAGTTKAILREAIVGIGVSYHFCVFGTSAGTPVVALQSSTYLRHKMRGLAVLQRERLATLPRVLALRPDVLCRVIRALINRESDSDRQEVSTPPLLQDEPIRRLRRMLLGDVTKDVQSGMPVESLGDGPPDAVADGLLE